MHNSLQIAKEGGTILAAKTCILGSAVVEAVSESALQMEHGSILGAFRAAVRAASNAEAKTAAVYAHATAAASASVGILMVFVLIGLCWGLEFVLTKRADQRLQEQIKHDPVERKHFLYAVNFVRYLISWHVVLNNFYEPTALGFEQTSSMGKPWAVFARWGCLATPWFFLVSGFCNSYSKIIDPDADQHEDFLQAMLKRVATWYPLYLVALTVCAVRLWSGRAEDWSHYMADVLLIHGIMWEEEYFPFLKGDWWLCFLTAYLLIWAPMHQVLVDSTWSVLWTLFYIAWLVALPSAIIEWYFMGRFPFFAMIQFWPSFVFGQGLACWFVKSCMKKIPVAITPGSAKTGEVYVMLDVHDIPPPVRFGCTVSFLIFGLAFFSFSPYDNLPLLKKPITPFLIKGGLLPLQGLMIAGLACEVDPMAKLFARKPFRWAEKLALTSFILQVPIHNCVKDLTGWDGLTWTFCGILVAASIAAHVLLERPWRRFLGIRDK